MRARKLGILILLTMLLLAAVVGLQGGLDFDITFRFDPVWIAAGILFGMFAIFLSARHPAAFIAPMLFAPRVMELPVFSRFAETRNLTALAVTAGILGLAIFMRFLWLCKQPGAIWDLFRGGKRAIIAYLLFAAVIALSYLYTPAPDSGGDKLLDFLVFGSLAFFAPFLLVRTEKDYRDFVIGTVIFSLAAAGYMLGASHQGRLAEHQHPQHIGVGQLVGWAILLLLFHRITDRYLRAAALFVCIPCLAVGLAAAETRGPLLALVLVLGLSMVFSRLKTSLISRRATAYVMLTVALAVFVLSTFGLWERCSTASRRRPRRWFSSCKGRPRRMARPRKGWRSIRRPSTPSLTTPFWAGVSVDGACTIFVRTTGVYSTTLTTWFSRWPSNKGSSVSLLC